MLKATIPASSAQVADRAAIIDLISTYAVAMDRRDWDLYRSIFMAELDLHYPEWTGGPRGLIPVDDWVTIVKHVLTGFDATQHLLVEHLVQLDGDSATVNVSMTARHVYSPTEVEYMGGYYVFGVVRQAGEWKLKAAALVSTWEEGPRELFNRA